MEENGEIIPNSAHHLSQQGVDLPPHFLLKQTSPELSPPPLGDVPVIDFGLLSLLNSSEESCNELHKLRSALSSYGYFQAINHGIPSSFLGEVRSIRREFFALPMEEKMKSARKVNEREGYGADVIYSDEQVLDLADRIFLSILPEDTQKLELWPANPPRFREVLLEYTNKIESISEVALKAIALSLDLDENSFLNLYGERASVYGRYNFYPRCSKPDAVLGLKAHKDGSGITMILADEVIAGLQTLKDGQWFIVPLIPDAIIFNVGDQTEALLFSKRSVAARVVHHCCEYFAMDCVVQLT